jgi:hypothetical protein
LISSALRVSFFLFYGDQLRNGENLLKAHRRHKCQLLANEKGIQHWKVSVGYGVFQAIVGLSVIAIRPLGLIAVIALLGLYSACFFAFGSLLRRSIARLA